MQSKNKKAPTVAERDHIERVKELPCSVCDEHGPSDAHEIKQGQWFTAVALCKSCHQGSLLGLHGQRRAWTLRKMDELDALAVTIQRLMTV
jgi:cytochrome c5